MRRGGSQKILININTTMPAAFACFLRNPENKTQLFNLMNKVLSNDESADRLHGKKFIMIVEGKSFQLTSIGSVVSRCELDNLHSTPEETDTRVVLYILYARSQGYKYAVVRSPDTDILLILLYYATYCTYWKRCQSTNH